MQAIKIPINADFTVNNASTPGLIEIVQNDLNAYDLELRTLGVADGESIKVVLSFGGETATLITENSDVNIWTCRVPQLPEGAVVIQIGRVADNFLHRIPTSIIGTVVREIPNGEIPEPQQEEIDRLIDLLNKVFGQADEAVAGANQAVVDANGAVDTANAASQAANQAVLDANHAVSSAAEAADTASSAVENAVEAVSGASQAVVNANDAVTAANNAVVTANTASQTANQAANDIKEAAERGDFNGADGAQGPKGDTGERGPQGIQGVIGPEGPDGKSAYEAAIEGGFPPDRTELQFNEDLAVVHEKMDRFGDVSISDEDTTITSLAPKIVLQFKNEQEGNDLLKLSGIATPTSDSDAVNKFYVDTLIKGMISGPGGWTRPTDRPVKPLMRDNMVLMLFGVSSASPNDMALFCSTSAGQYKVDWGDGTFNNYNTGTKAEHLYDFDSITAPADSTGYKMVWITVESLTGNIVQLYLNQRHSQRPAESGNNIFIPAVFEMYIQCPYMTTLYWTAANGVTRYSLLEIFSLDVNQVTSPTYLLRFCGNLKKIEKLRLENAATVNYLLGGCFSYNEELPFPTNLGNIGEGFMADCLSYSKPITQTIVLTGNADTVLYNSSPTFHRLAYNHSLCVDLSRSANQLFSTAHLPALRGLRLPNIGLTQSAVTVTNTSMDIAALILLFSDLADRSQTTSGTITITGCFGASRLTSADRAVATVKNWVVVG